MTRKPPRPLQKNWLEWSVFTVGLVFVLGIVAYLVYDSLTSSGLEPAITVEVGKIRRTAGGWAVRVEAENSGGVTAEDLRIAVVLEANGREQERVELDLPFVPRHSRRGGWVEFRHDPSVGRLSGYAVGYGTP
jgi:uncharacterized protein (TIGR02588 family)